MGQGASASAGPGGGASGQQTSRAQPAKTCYYELLAVSRDATQEEIKRAYKKKALELHPDRNFNNVEEATQLFTGIQAAYEVLSDPQERAWYDSHREQILGGYHDDGSTGATPRPASVTTSEDILELFFMFATKIPYDENAPNNFYAVLGKAFKKIADEEIAAAEWANEDPVYYPDFGNSKSTHEDWVKQFYTAWGGFWTQKSFSWCDVYRYQDAPDRRVKRIMEKENKKMRDSAIREYNDTVRSFVQFVRKRDPRFIKNTQSEAERQATLLAASREQAARQRKENLNKLKDFKAAGWTQVSPEPEAGTDEFDNEADGDSDEESVVERYECVVCKKTFGSEGQMDAHERSKKHTKNVQALKRQMRRENKELGLNSDLQGVGERNESTTTEVPDGQGEENGEGPDMQKEMEDLAISPGIGREDADVQKDIERPTISLNIDASGLHTEKAPTPPSPRKSDNSDGEDGSGDEGDDYISAEKFAQRTLNTPPSPPPPAPKIGRAKAKRAKKAAQQAAKTDGISCASCKATFPSNTKMFDHLRDNPSHAQPVAGGGSGGKGKGKAKKK